MKTQKKKRPFDTLDHIERSAPPNPAEMFRHGDLFSLRDHSLVRRAIQSTLTDDEEEIITLYFWNDLQYEEISKAMDMTNSKVGSICETAMRKIRKFCMEQPEFSRYPAYRFPCAA